MNPIRTAVFAALAVAALAGCGERPQVHFYEQGKYQGKPDDQPWDNALFNNDRSAWINAVKTRQQNQNEYRKIQ